MRQIGSFSSRTSPLVVEVWQGWIWCWVKFEHSSWRRGRFRSRDDAMIFASALEDYYSWKYRARGGQRKGEGHAD
jgi:hypothetical protein